MYATVHGAHVLLLAGGVEDRPPTGPVPHFRDTEAKRRFKDPNGLSLTVSRHGVKEVDCGRESLRPEDD